MGLDRKTKQKMLTSAIVSVVIVTVIISGVITQYPVERIGDWEPITDEINKLRGKLSTLKEVGSQESEFRMLHRHEFLILTSDSCILASLNRAFHLMR